MLSYRDRAVTLAALVVFGLALLPAVALPPVFGSAGRWMLVALLVGLVCAGTEAVVRTHPQAWRLRQTFHLWVLPTSVVVLAAIVLPQSPTPVWWLAGLVLTGCLLALVEVAEYRTLDPTHPDCLPARLIVTASAHLVAFGLFLTAEGLWAETMAAVGGGLLSLAVLSEQEGRLRRPACYATVIALAIGQVRWAVGQVEASKVASGLLLLLAFYLSTGLAQQEMRGRLGWRVVAEFAAVTLLGLGIVVWCWR